MDVAFASLDKIEPHADQRCFVVAYHLFDKPKGEVIGEYNILRAFAHPLAALEWAGTLLDLIKVRHITVVKACTTTDLLANPPLDQTTYLPLSLDRKLLEMHHMDVRDFSPTYQVRSYRSVLVALQARPANQMSLLTSAAAKVADTTEQLQQLDKLRALTLAKHEENISSLRDLAGSVASVHAWRTQEIPDLKPLSLPTLFVETIEKHIKEFITTGVVQSAPSPRKKRPSSPDDQDTSDHPSALAEL